jgi:hypothetical protein
MAGKHLSLLVHFVWSTAGREPWITAEWNHRALWLYLTGGAINSRRFAAIRCQNLARDVNSRRFRDRETSRQ